MITPVAIGVAAGLGTLIISFFLIRFYLWMSRKRISNPLPPVQMLAHHRLKQQEVYLSQATYAADLQALSPVEHSPGRFDSETSSAAVLADAHQNLVDSPGAPESSMSCSSSRAELFPSEDLPSCPTSHVHISSRSSFSSSPSMRGPHKRLNGVDTVFPEPSAHGSRRTSAYDQRTPPHSRPASEAKASLESEPSCHLPQVPDVHAPPMAAEQLRGRILSDHY